MRLLCRTGGSTEIMKEIDTLKVETSLNGTELTVFAHGRINTSTAPAFDEEISPYLESITSLILDFEDLIYLSSTGLALLLKYQKAMTAKNGTLLVRHPCDTVYTILEASGFTAVLAIE